ncbi:hypothetical protein AA0488_1172 [Kozakia baliensis NRIC 0488]|nr:hypothetical protein AA0488_1172 [Kozakia baliensis NRIC 0488]
MKKEAADEIGQPQHERDANKPAEIDEEAASVIHLFDRRDEGGYFFIGRLCHRAVSVINKPPSVPKRA